MNPRKRRVTDLLSKQVSFREVITIIGGITGVLTIIGGLVAVMSHVDTRAGEFVELHRRESLDRAHPSIEKKFVTQAQFEKLSATITQQMRSVSSTLDDIKTSLDNDRSRKRRRRR